MFGPKRQDGVDGISALRSGEIWLHLTFGLTELFEKESDDPELTAIRTPNGLVSLLATVGVTAAELELMRSTSTAEVLNGLRHTSPLLVTDPARD